LRLPELSVEAGGRQLQQRGVRTASSWLSPVADTTITVDDEGFILDYPGLAERI